jgi:branched-chain amino acid transport system permease protein
LVGVAVFFALPELLRVAKFYRLVLLGVVIVISVLYMPEGIVGDIRKRITGWRRKSRNA